MPRPHLPSLSLPLPQPTDLHPPRACPQEELPAILKHKKSLQKLVSDWNALKSRWEPQHLGVCGESVPRSPHRGGHRALRLFPHEEDPAGPIGYRVYLCLGTHAVRVHVRVPLCMSVCMCSWQLGVTPKPGIAINNPPRSLGGRRAPIVYPATGGAVTTRPTTRWRP